MKRVEIIQATSAHYIHVVPGELERVTITPEKSAIFQYLSRIGSDRFVEFIMLQNCASNGWQQNSPATRSMQRTSIGLAQGSLPSAART